MSEAKGLNWKKIGSAKRAQYRVSHLSEIVTRKSAHLSGDDGTMDLKLEIIANEDCLIVTYYHYGKTAMDDFFFEFVRETSSIEEGKQWAAEIDKWTGFDTSIRYLVSEFKFELQS